MSSVVKQEWWDKTWGPGRPIYNEAQIPFKHLFEKYLPRSGSCLEIGCYPGRFLIYFARHFGYQVSGIDLTPATSTLMPAFLQSEGVEAEQLICGDFFGSDLKTTYDVVCSFGFIEHFSNHEEVLRRHFQFVKPGGWVVVSTPNFRWLNFAYHRLFDRQNLERHVLGAMHPRAWAQLAQKEGMVPVYAGWAHTAGLWFEDPPTSRVAKSIASRLANLAGSIDRQINLPNRFTSPHCVMFARKP